MRVVGKDKIPTDEDLKEMHYVDNVLKETLRLYPSVPQTRYHTAEKTSHFSRVAAHDDELPDGTKIKAGDRIAYAQYFLHRNPKYWERPEEFIPERWENSNLKHAFQCMAKIVIS